MRRRKSVHHFIYATPHHLAATFAVLSLPVIALGLLAYVENIALGPFLIGVALSSVRLFIAYLIAVVVGWVLAVSFATGKRSAVALPVFDVLQSFPTFAALPLAIALWGVSNLTVILFLVITVIWPIFFSIVSSRKLIRRDWQDAATMSGLKGFKYLRYFIIPATLPGLITGSIIGLGEGWEALVATEIIVGIKSGLGPFFSLNNQNVTITIFGISALLVIIFTINKLLWLPLLQWGHGLTEE